MRALTSRRGGGAEVWRHDAKGEVVGHPLVLADMLPRCPSDLDTRAETCRFERALQVSADGKVLVVVHASTHVKPDSETTRLGVVSLAEPWADGDIRYVTPSDPADDMTPQNFERNVEYARRTGATRVYLWGAEWWLLQEQKYGDSAWMTLARQAIAHGEAGPGDVAAR